MPAAPSVAEYLKQYPPLFSQGFRHDVTRSAWPFHNHTELEIAFLTRGRGTLMFPDGHTLQIEQEGFTLVPPGLPHQSTLELPAETAAILIELKEPLPAILETVSYIPPHKNPHLIAEIMYLTAPPPDMTPLQRVEFDLRAGALLATLLQQIDRPKTSLDEGALYVGMAHDFIQRHFARIRNIEEVATHVGVSYHHLRHLFKTHRQISLKQFLTNLRINHAKQLLVLSRLLVKEIAESCGFDSERHFSTYFKQCEGVSPDTYRRQHAKQYAANFAAPPGTTPEPAAPASTAPPACLGIKQKKPPRYQLRMPESPSCQK